MPAEETVSAQEGVPAEAAPTLQKIKGMTRILLVLALLVMSCGPNDPRERELRAESAYARSLAEHSVVRNLARTPQTKAMTPSSVVGAMFSTMADVLHHGRGQSARAPALRGRAGDRRPLPRKARAGLDGGVIPDDERGKATASSSTNPCSWRRLRSGNIPSTPHGAKCGQTILHREIP